MAVQEQVRQQRATAGHRETHVPRDLHERPLVALCGMVAWSAEVEPRDGCARSECTCVVCLEMWESGVRPVGY